MGKWLLIAAGVLVALKATGNCPLCSKSAAAGNGGGGSMNFGVQYPTIDWPVLSSGGGSAGGTPGFGVGIDTGLGGGVQCAQVLTRCADGSMGSTPCDCASHGGVMPPSSGGGLTL